MQTKSRCKRFWQEPEYSLNWKEKNAVEKAWIHHTRVQILDEADCISYSTNTLEKGMDPRILPPAMGK